jgi:hypothetical protein
VVCKPSTNELKRGGVRPDELGHLFLAKVSAISETDSGTRE